MSYIPTIMEGWGGLKRPIFKSGDGGTGCIDGGSGFIGDGGGGCVEGWGGTRLPIKDD